MTYLPNLINKCQLKENQKARKEINSVYFFSSSPFTPLRLLTTQQASLVCHQINSKAKTSSSIFTNKLPHIPSQSKEQIKVRSIENKSFVSSQGFPRYLVGTDKNQMTNKQNLLEAVYDVSKLQTQFITTNKMSSKRTPREQHFITKSVHNLNKQNLLLISKVSNLTLSEKFINLLMINGKKIKAYNIFYESLRFLEEKNFLNSLKSSKHSLELKAQAKGAIFTRNLIVKAIENIKPSVEVRKVRKGGITYQVPALIPKKRQETLAIRWIIDAAKNRKKNSKISFAECLALELTEASKKLGKPRQKRDELHKLAESNRAYIRFRWW